MQTPLTPIDTDLVGEWVVDGHRVVGDATCERIEWLVARRLEEIARDQSGWFTLFRDPADGRLWERSYPRGEMHGGGPPRLTVLDAQQARARYGSSVV